MLDVNFIPDDSLMSSEKIPVYFMPGMAANPKIFENIQLDAAVFDIHYLSWELPHKNESLQSYASRIAQRIRCKSPVLVGVSFGGILVQEIAKIIAVRKIIVISSVKSTRELPKKMLFAKHTNIHKLLPTQLVTNMELVAKFALGDFMQKRIHLYEKYLSVRDPYYIDWSIDQIVNWEQAEAMPNTIHIQGELDNVFPVNYIKDYISIPRGTHSMIIFKYKWFNENLPDILKD